MRIMFHAYPIKRDMDTTMENMTTLLIGLTAYLIGLCCGGCIAQVITNYRQRMAARKVDAMLRGDLPSLLRRQAG